MTSLLAAASTTVLAHDGPYDHGWFPWFPLIPLFFFGLWVLLFVLFARRWRGGWGPRAGESAEQVLAQRYARGEIDEDQWVRIRTGLDKRQ